LKKELRDVESDQEVKEEQL